MTWVWVAVVLVLLTAAALVAMGYGGAMAPGHTDRPEVTVPGDRALTAADLGAVRFSTAWRGYRTDEVDDLLERLGAEIGDRDALVARLSAQLESAQDPGCGEPPWQLRSALGPGTAAGSGDGSAAPDAGPAPAAGPAPNRAQTAAEPSRWGDPQ